MRANLLPLAETLSRSEDDFRRDRIPPPIGYIIAEFACGTDALNFARLKGSTYTVTPGINKMYAVRRAA